MVRALRRALRFAYRGGRLRGRVDDAPDLAVDAIHEIEEAVRPLSHVRSATAGDHDVGLHATFVDIDTMQ